MTTDWPNLITAVLFLIAVIAVWKYSRELVDEHYE